MRWVMVAGTAGDDAKPYQLAALPGSPQLPGSAVSVHEPCRRSGSRSAHQEPAVPARVVGGTRIVTAWGTTRAEMRSVISRVPPSSS